MFEIILKQCILKKIPSMVEEHIKKLVPYSGECEYHLDYKSKDKDKPCGLATIYHPLLIENHKRN